MCNVYFFHPSHLICNINNQTSSSIQNKTLSVTFIKCRYCKLIYVIIIIVFQITSDFVSAATKGAMTVVDGNVMAINPGEDEK